MNDFTRSKRVRQRPKTKILRRHQNQPLLWPDRVGPVFANRQIRVNVEQRGKITPYGGVSLAHDPAMTGGSDSHFFRRLHRAGFSIVWADAALVSEWIPKSRACFGWLVRRFFRAGNTIGFVTLDLGSRGPGASYWPPKQPCGLASGSCSHPADF